MITSFLLAMLIGLISLLVGFLPTGNLPIEFTNAIGTVFGILNTFSYLIAVDTLLLLVGLVIVFDGVVLLWNFINWIIRKIPGMQ